MSASVNRSHSPCASRAPVVTALFLPVQPAGRGPASITRTLGERRGDFAGAVGGVVVDDDDFEGDAGLGGQGLEAGAEVGFFVARGDDDGDLWVRSDVFPL